MIWSRRPPAANRIAGFTLMETLVMLMLVSMAATLMFQMLDSYRIAQQRIAAQAGAQDRSALFEAWLVDAVHGLLADPDKPFKGSSLEFEGTTLNPLFNSPGTPADIRWRLLADRDGGEVVYFEDGVERWKLPLRDFDGSRFVYFSLDGSQHAQWPPAKGVQEALPAGVAFIRGAGALERVRFSAVRGPLEPRKDPFELERD